MEAFLNGPSMVPPPGQVVNFKNPSDMLGACITIVAICMVLSTITTALRMYTRTSLAREVGVEDIILVAAWPFYIITGALGIVTFADGCGRHQWNVRLENLSSILYYYRIVCIFWFFPTMAIKNSLVIQILKIFNPPRKHGFLFWTGSGLIAIITIFYVICIFLLIFVCSPISKEWKPWIQGHCINFLGVDVATAVINTFADIMILLLPTKSIWNLKMSFSKKIQASIVFALILIALATSVVRLYYTIKLMKTEDKTYYMGIMLLWGYTECTILVACANMPSMARLARVWGSRFSRKNQDVTQRATEVEKTRRVSFRTPYSVGMSTMDHEGTQYDHE